MHICGRIIPKLKMEEKMNFDPDYLLEYSEKLYDLAKNPKKTFAKVTAMSYGEAACAAAVAPTLSLLLFLSDTPAIAAPQNFNFSTINAVTTASSNASTVSFLSGSNIFTTSSGDEGKLDENLNFPVIAHSPIR